MTPIFDWAFPIEPASVSVAEVKYDIENNKRTVKDFELFGLAYVLKIDVNDLLEDIRNEYE